MLLMFCGRGGCCNNGCGAVMNNGCGCGRERSGRENANDCGCRERRNDCGCNEQEADCGRAEESRDCCDIPTMIPQPWQEYARRDADDCDK